MARKRSTHLTDAELRLMDVLWEKGSATVSEVVEDVLVSHINHQIASQAPGDGRVVDIPQACTSCSAGRARRALPVGPAKGTDKDFRKDFSIYKCTSF